MESLLNLDYELNGDFWRLGNLLLRYEYCANGEVKKNSNTSSGELNDREREE
jgi:hypothetical protein